MWICHLCQKQNTKIMRTKRENYGPTTCPWPIKDRFLVTAVSRSVRDMMFRGGAIQYWVEILVPQWIFIFVFTNLTFSLFILHKNFYISFLKYIFFHVHSYWNNKHVPSLVVIAYIAGFGLWSDNICSLLPSFSYIQELETTILRDIVQMALF